MDTLRKSQVDQNHKVLSLSPDTGFSAVFDSSGEALLVVDTTGRIQRANRRARELLHIPDSDPQLISLTDCLSRMASEPLADIWIHRKPAQTLDVSLATGFPVRITLRAILPDSQHLLLCLEEGSLVQRADAKCRQMEAELRSVLDSTLEGLILVDPTGQVRFSNVRFGQLFGFDARALEQLRTFDELEEVVEGRFRSVQTFGARWRSFQNGRGDPTHDNLEIVRPSYRLLERFSRPVLDTQGRSVGWLEVYWDMTSERQTQTSMLQTEKAAALGRLVSGIAHELNNPLTAVMGYAQILLGRGLTPAQLAEAEKVYEGAERARHIVKNLLYFARENEPERTLVDLNELVERTLALRSYELKIENIVVKREFATELAKTMADPFQLQQVVLNLLVNAEQALLEDRGQGNIEIRTSENANRKGRWLTLEIADDGPGIPPEILKRIFDPFFTTKPPGVGTGLGLSIVYGIVHQHGGNVTVDSRPRVGTRFTVELPIIPAADTATLSIQATRTPAGAAGPSRILIVEDEPTVAQLIADVLRDEGHQAEVVLESQDGLSKLSRWNYDLVICDLRMPRLDGIAFYDALVRSGCAASNRILFITGDTLAPRSLEFLGNNRLPYLTKPFLVEELKLAVNRMLTDDEEPAAKGQSAVKTSSSAPGA